MTEKRYYTHKYLLKENEVHDKICHRFMSIDETVEHMNNEYWKYKQLKEENEKLKIRNKGKQAFIDKQDKIIKLLYNQCKDFKEILDDSNITYPIDERLNKFFEEGVKL